MLALFAANDALGLGRSELAKPLLAGAHKDLSDLLLRQFDMARAWRRWDAGRALAPRLGLIFSVNEFEQSSLALRADYFLATAPAPALIGP
jgi:hypothetical protein